MMIYKPFMRILVLILGMVFAWACGPPQFAVKSDVKGVVAIEPLPRNKSVVVFIRPSSYSGAIGLHVFDGKKIIGHCYGQTYFYYLCPPGEHVFSSALENFAFMKATLLPGKIYYVRIAPLFGMAQLRTLIFPIYPGSEDWQKLPRWLSEVRETTPTPKLAQWEIDNRVKIMKRYQKYYEPWAASPTFDNALLPEYGRSSPVQKR